MMNIGGLCTQIIHFGRFGSYTKFVMRTEVRNESISQVHDYDIVMKLKEISKDIYDVSAWLEEQYGKVGSPEREEFRREAYAYYMGQLIHDARKQEKMTQTELAQRIGSNKSYISKIENGIITGNQYFLPYN